MVGLAHIILSKKISNPLLTVVSGFFNFWVFDKSNEEALISNTNSA